MGGRTRRDVLRDAGWQDQRDEDVLAQKPLKGVGTKVHLGTQGWDYPAWVGPFYPPGARPQEFLSIYTRALDTVEVDSTYYATPAEHVVRGWAEKVAAGFTFALKLPEDLSPAGDAAPDPARLALFCERARLLGDHLGPVLIQLGAQTGPERWEAVERFLAALAARVQSVYGYFSNQFQGHAPASARAMQRLIGQKIVEPDNLGAQRTLF